MRKRARFYGVPCWNDDETGELIGKNALCDWLIIHWSFPLNELISFLQHLVDPDYEGGLAIKVWDEEDTP